MNRITHLAQRITSARAFEFGIIVIIILNALLLGLGTSPAIEEQYGNWIQVLYEVALAIFVLEALLKMAASSPRVVGYFRDGWNVFDFLVVVLALIPVTGQFATIARLVRLLLRNAARVDHQRPARNRYCACQLYSKRGTRHHADGHHRIYLRHHWHSLVQRA